MYKYFFTENCFLFGLIMKGMNSANFWFDGLHNIGIIIIINYNERLKQVTTIEYINFKQFQL